MNKKITESISLGLRKKWITSSAKTFLIIAILVVAFLTLNLWIKNQDLPKIDITENKVYTLSNESINEIKNIDSDVMIYVYGYTEKDTVVDLIKQYIKNNSSISYSIITNDNNLTKIQEFGLENGNQALIIEVGESNKILYSSDFVSYDYTTYQQIDLTENAITNAILNLTIAQKPKVYFLSGHNELSIENYLTTLIAYMQNEVFDYGTLNLLTVESIPEDCDLIAIMSPQKDLMEQEVTLLQNYINNGGNLIMTSDLYTTESTSLPNWQRILDLYGINIDNGAIYEANEGSAVANYPIIFMPQIENTEITSDIATDGALILEYARRINLPDEAKSEELNVEYEKLLSSSEKSFFVTDFSDNLINSISTQTPQSNVISAKITKTISGNSEEGNEQEAKQSQMIVISNGTFVTNVESMISQGVSKVNLYNNADFFISCVANLTNRDDTISVRKEMSSSTYAPTETENKVVLAIIFIVPILIIIIGIIVWNYRRHKR